MKPENEAEANVIKSVLAEHGIYAEIKSFHDTAYDGLFQAQYGWGLILVSEKDLPEAQRIIEEWRSAAPEELPLEVTKFLLIHKKRGSGPLLTHLMQGTEQESSTDLTPGGRDALDLSIFESRKEITGGRAVQTSRTKSNCQLS